MKKGIIFVIAALLLGIQVIAQDVIYFNNGSQQKAKVSEVRVDEVVYKKTENLNGPIYTTKKSEIQMIEFSNGYKETFTAVNNNTNNNSNNNYTANTNTPQSYNNNTNTQPQNNQGGRTYETNNYYTTPSRPNVYVNVNPWGGGYGGWGGGYYRPNYYYGGGWGWAGGGWGWGGGYHHGGHHHRHW